MDENFLIDVYHTIISELECPKISGEVEKERKFLYTIRNSDYVLHKREIISFLKNKFNINISNSEKIFNLLLRKGFLVEIPTQPNEEEADEFRTLHMDVLVRSAEIRTKWSSLRYIVSPKFLVFPIDSPSDRDRKYIPSLDGNFMNTILYNAIKRFFEDNKVSADYVQILKDYLPSGLDGYQAYSLALMLITDKTLNIVTAPTGAGKTEIFLLFILARLMRSKFIKGENERVVLVYPRKTLSIDQSSRIIRLLHIANQHGYRITFGLRDGHTPGKYDIRKGKVKDGDPFRGIKCPKCNGNLVYRLNYGSVQCDSCFTYFDFVKSTRPSLGKTPPDVIVTNMWALEVRMMDNVKNDINVHTFENLGVLVIDEAHEYTGLGGGLISYLIKLMLNNTSNKNPKVIISSATIPSPIEFASKLTGLTSNSSQLYDFYETSKKLEDYNISFTGKRLVIIGIFNINPKYSWSTYCQLWAVMMAFLNYTYELSEKEYKPQSIIFINNIKELRRTYRGYEENISLGEPRDHLIGPEEYGKPLESTDAYSYWHYLPFKIRNKIFKIFKQGNKLDVLANRVGEIHSLASEDERKRVIESLSGKYGEVAVVFSTSSLELGVDYQNVSFILNTGITNPLSLIQRIGRGGRRPNTLCTVLGIILARNLPSESLALHDPKTIEKLNPTLMKNFRSLPVAVDNPQVIRRGKLVEAISTLAKSGKKTYASQEPISNWTQLNEFLAEIIETVKDGCV